MFTGVFDKVIRLKPLMVFTDYYQMQKRYLCHLVTSHHICLEGSSVEQVRSFSETILSKIGAKMLGLILSNGSSLRDYLKLHLWIAFQT